MKTKRKSGMDDIMGITVLGERGQLVIPKDIRDALKLEAGSKFVVVLHEGSKLVLFPADKMKGFMDAMSERFDSISKLLND